MVPLFSSQNDLYYERQNPPQSFHVQLKRLLVFHGANNASQVFIVALRNAMIVPAQI